MDDMHSLTTFRLESSNLPGVFVESDVELTSSPDWFVPLALLRAMADRRSLTIAEPISRTLATSLDTIQDIYASWVPALRRVATSCSTTERQAAQGVSVFFSGGVDSFYSLLKHRGEIDNLILIHGFDISLADTNTFALAEAQARSAADLFGKRLIVVRTNLHWEQKPNLPCGWGMYHGAALAAIVHALTTCHSKVYIASSFSYADLHPWGSHPLLDPLWSSEAVQIIHDGGETRVEKLRAMVQYPEMLSRLRVCWENSGELNCGRCEKCLRTMLALRGLGAQSAAFPDTLTPQMVRIQELTRDSVLFWRELLGLNLPSDLAAAVRGTIRDWEVGLPPHASTFRREVKRCLYASRQIIRNVKPVFRALLPTS
jgi:hypothetical protein